jgi:hypothetical protein
MSIPVVDISADDVRKILRLEEGHFTTSRPSR